MNADELKAAAERWARVNYGECNECYDQFCKDWRLLADAMVARLAADERKAAEDALPADDEWLLQVTRGIRWRLKWDEATREAFLGETSIGIKKTRRQWNDLLADLGVKGGA